MTPRLVLISALSSSLLISLPVAAQINIAAIAQFKYNQQHALAASLSKTQPGNEKRQQRKGDKATSSQSKPAVIYAHKPSFKANYGDMHTKNVR